MRTILILLLLGAGAAAAQEKADDTKKRMVFPVVQARPAPSAQPAAPGPAMSLNPAAQPQPLASGPIRPADPIDALDAFFSALKSGQVDAAYDALVAGTIIADRREDVAGLKAKTKQALDSYGPVGGYEPVETVEIGTCLRRHTCISLNQDLPLRWKFYFYRNAAGWRLVDLRVDDGLAELFDDVARNKKK